MSKSIKEPNTFWTTNAIKHLRGARIMKVEYMSSKEVEDNMWYKSPLCLLLQKPDGTQFWMQSTSDDEGNDGGSYHTTLKDYPIIPGL